MKVKPGYKQTEAGIIPKDWEVKQFTEVTDLITCGIAATPEYVPESRGYPFLSSTNIKEGRVVWSGYKHINAALHRHLYRNNPPKRGDILYSRVGTFGEAAVIDVDFEFSVYVSLTLIKPKKVLDSFFLMHLLNSETYKRRAKDQIYLGGGVGNLNVDVVRHYPIVVPPLPEQRAIAAALSDVDGLLGGLDRLIAKKRDLKQAAMLQLLTGQTRLPGFHGEWEDMYLGNLFTFKNGLNKGKEFFGFGTPIVNYMDVFANAGIYCSKLEGRVSLNKQEINNFDVRRGDVLFTRTSETPEEVGMASVILDEPIQTVFSGFVLRGRPKNERLCNAFKAYCFRSPFVRNQITSKASYTTRALTNGRILSAVILSVPSLPEQTAIAAVLSYMDAELASLEKRREKTRALKQAMMEELLTGKTRLITAGESHARTTSP